MRANIDRAPGVVLVTDSPHVALEPDVLEHLDFETPDVEPDVPATVVLCSRLTAGLGVQLLTNRSDDEPRAWITLVLNGECETFEIQPEDALDAFAHPFAFGGTLPL